METHWLDDIIYCVKKGEEKYFCLPTQTKKNQLHKFH